MQEGRSNDFGTSSGKERSLLRGSELYRPKRQTQNQVDCHRIGCQGKQKAGRSLSARTTPSVSGERRGNVLRRNPLRRLYGAVVDHHQKLHRDYHLRILLKHSQASDRSIFQRAQYHTARTHRQAHSGLLSEGTGTCQRVVCDSLSRQHP